MGGTNDCRRVVSYPITMDGGPQDIAQSRRACVRASGRPGRRRMSPHRGGKSGEGSNASRRVGSSPYAATGNGGT